jgi:membrane protease YdiL (CAAX protease family)
MSKVRPVLFGAEGLRHGWRFLLFVFGMWLADRYASRPLLDFLAARSGINLQELSAGLLWLVAMILVGLNEEYLFRGYALQSLWRGAGFWPATLIINALFAGAHVPKPHENAMDIGMICVLGVALCLSVRRTGSLWWAMGWHAAFDFGQFFLIGTRNGGQAPVGHLLDVGFPGPAWLTGGELGTEASVIMVPVAIAMFIYCGWFLPKAAPSRAPGR